MREAEFVMGQMVEVTAEEHAKLHSSADLMRTATEDMQPGWLGVYLMRHREAHAVISEIFKRSHASS